MFLAVFGLLLGCSSIQPAPFDSPVVLTLLQEPKFDAIHHLATVPVSILITNTTEKPIAIDLTKWGPKNIRTKVELVDKSGSRYPTIPSPPTMGSMQDYGRSVLAPKASFTFDQSLSFIIPAPGTYQLRCELEIVDMPPTVDAAGVVHVFDQKDWPTQKLSADPMTIHLK